jgi:putative ABC transport system permease protein
MMQELHLIIDELKYRKLQSALMFLSVVIAFITYGVLGAFRYSLNSGEGSVSERRLIVTHEAGIIETLPLAHLERLRNIPGTGNVGHATWTGSYFQEQRNMLMVFAVDPEAWLDQHPDMLIDEEEVQRFLANRNGMLISQSLARKFGWRTGDIVPLQSILFPPPDGEQAWTHTVSGTFTSSDSGGARNYIIIHYDYLNENRTFWRDTVGTFIVTPDEATSAMVLAQRIDAALAQSAAPTSSTTDRAFHNAFFAQFGDVVQIIKAVIGIAFASLVLVITSGMALSIRQRSRDLGIMRVLGFSSGMIYRLIIGQTALLVAVGAILGLGVATVLNLLVTRSLPQFLPDLAMPLQVIGEAAVISVFVALVTAVLPALIALRVRPIEAFALEQN